MVNKARLYARQPSGHQGPSTMKGQMLVDRTKREKGDVRLHIPVFHNYIGQSGGGSFYTESYCSQR